MPIKPIDLEFFNREGKNVHEAIVAASKRARQLNEETKIEFNQRIETLNIKMDASETAEETDVNPDQLRVSLEFEKRPKSTDVALEELLRNKLAWRYKETEEPPEAKTEEPVEPEE
ncbi:MAG TPA: DNA-directed RNA polymerase subunit omega [Bacteroidota bacterium]